MNAIPIDRFNKFSTDELYILMRQAMESSWNIVMKKDAQGYFLYPQEERYRHACLLEEVSEAYKNREDRF